MYLLKLYSNKEQFKNIEFFKTGITIIKGKKISSNTKDTYNGVGKSLLIKIIDFCLGCSKINDFSKLKDWEFFLDVEINNSIYTISRRTDNQNEISVNHQTYSLDNFHKYIGDKLFKINEPIKNLTYRTLITRFLRPSKQSYVSYKKIFTKETDYNAELAIAFLLGLDVKLLDSKRETKEKLEKEIKNKKFYEKDERISKFFEKGKDIKVTITNIKSKILSLEEQLKTFKINSEFSKLKLSKNDLSKEREKILNDISLFNLQIDSIRRSLDIHPDIPAQEVIDIYNEIKITFSDNIKKTLNEVFDFHKKLLDSRIARLKNDLTLILKKKKKSENSLKKINNNLDILSSTLTNTGTFEEYEVLNNEYILLKNQLNDLERYNNIISDTKETQANLKLQLDQANIETESYLKEINSLIEKIILIFKNFSEQFYRNKESGISIKVNSNINKQRFDIDAYIDSDTSDGVNEVKIFCFDLTLLNLKNHNVHFLLHDSRLLSNMDARQQCILFKLASIFTEEHSFQYIISINENTLDGMKEVNEWNEIVELFEGNNNRIKLELTDENDSSKLLGETIKLNYEK